MPARRLKEFLDQEKVEYATIIHSPAYTAQGIAHSAHISGKELAKTVILKIDDRLTMAVVPANHRVSTGLFKDAIGADVVEIATENEFADAFPGCELGAMPPFGNLWGMPVYIDERLIEDEAIAFNAGNHTELIQLSLTDFMRLVQPTIVSITGALTG